MPRDQYYDFADPPYHGEEPEAKPKPDPNALSKWELKAMKKGTLVWDSPGYPSIRLHHPRQTLTARKGSLTLR